MLPFVFLDMQGLIDIVCYLMAVDCFWDYESTFTLRCAHYLYLWYLADGTLSFVTPYLTQISRPMILIREQVYERSMDITRNMFHTVAQKVLHT